jgi:ABC-2 type transport system permease protein
VSPPRRREGAVLNVYRAELRKLTVQLPTRVLALVCALGPFAFGAVLSLQSGVPADTLLGAWVHSSGYAVSFVVLGFCAYLGFPVLAGVLAGDSFSSEDRYGTWKSVLTRSRGRGELFVGKLLALGALTVALVALAALSSLLAGVIFTGDQSLVGLGGTVIPSGESLLLTLASWLACVPAVLAFVSLAVLLSVASRNGIVGVIGPVLAALVMQLLLLVGTGSWMHTLLLASAFDDWSGLIAAPRFYGQLAIGAGVSLVWLVACLTAAWLLLRRREFTGTPVARRAGWVTALRWVLIGAAVVVALAAAGGLGPAAITRARLESSMASVFDNLTRLQQRELGHAVALRSTLALRTLCARHAGVAKGPGDDWTCTISVVSPGPGAEPYELTPVTYDVSVKADGCYKADAPPSFVGQQTMTAADGRTVVNPLFTIYGCFDPSGAVARAAGPQTRRPRGHERRTKAELESLREAEREAGSAVMRRIKHAEKQAVHEAEAVEEVQRAQSGG